MMLELFQLGLLCIGNFGLFVGVDICYYIGFRFFWDFKLMIMFCFMGFEIMVGLKMVFQLLVRFMCIVSL